jgi:hypothetical protein
VRVQRQVVGQQVDVVRQQALQALLHPAGDGAVLPAPEQAVVHQDGIGIRRDGGVDQRAAGGDAADQRRSPAPFHLQPVGAVVPETLGLQFGVQGGEQLRAGNGHVKAGAARAMRALSGMAPSRVAPPAMPHNGGHETSVASVCASGDRAAGRLVRGAHAQAPVAGPRRADGGSLGTISILQAPETPVGASARAA